MSYANHVDQLASHRRWVARNPKKFRTAVNKVNTRRRNAAKMVLRQYKDKPCMDCGVKYPYYVMQLDHRDPSTKLTHPGRVPSRGWSEEKTLAEFEKCDVVCANCHMERTHQQRLKAAGVIGNVSDF